MGYKTIFNFFFFFINWIHEYWNRQAGLIIMEEVYSNELSISTPLSMSNEEYNIDFPFSLIRFQIFSDSMNLSCKNHVIFFT